MTSMSQPLPEDDIVRKPEFVPQIKGSDAASQPVPDNIEEQLLADIIDVSRSTFAPSGPVWRTVQAPANILVNDPGEDAGSTNNTQSEPSLAVRLPNVVVSFNDTRVADHGCGWARSETAGSSFIDEGSTVADSSADGVLAVDNAGTFFFAFLSVDAKGRSSVAVARSVDGGATFGPPVQASLSSNNPQVEQDKEWIAADLTGKATDGNLYVAWTSLDHAAGEAAIQFSRSTDHGLTWSKAMRLSEIGPMFGHHGAMPAVAPDGTVYVAWTDRLTGQHQGL